MPGYQRSLGAISFRGDRVNHSQRLSPLAFFCVVLAVSSLARFTREGQLSEEFLYERDNGRIVEEFG